MKSLPLPKGWQELQIKDVGDILGGGTPSTKNKEYWNGSILWLTPTEVTSLKTKYLYDTERKITELGLKNSSARIIKPNSLIICTRATIGDCCINKKEISTNQGFKSITPNSNFDVVFLYYLISYNRNILILNSSGSTFLEISKSNLENLSFYFPSLDEQKRISEILSLCDDVIENLTKLIEKKELYKKGVMQRVLSGEVRFKGFKDEWKTVKLSSLVKIQNGYAFKSSEFQKNGIPIIRISNISNETNYMDMKDLVYYNKIEKDEAFTILKNDLLIAMSGATAGKTSIYNLDTKAYLNQRVGVFRIIDCKKIYNSFLAQYIFSCFF
ncbi:restriction endonuclease subunit S, partial [Brachyspira hampsonii]|nr:restriction endonuclease subunit S [Brachyspira hampsonii]